MPSLFSVWKSIEPVNAYVQGEKTAGKLFIPSESNITEALEKLSAIKTADPAERKIIEALKLDLTFEEPRFAVSGAVGIIYSYLVKKATTKEMETICTKLAEMMRVSRTRLAKKQWPAERLIQTTAACNALDVLLGQVVLPGGMKELLQKENELYRQAFFMPGVSKGLFEDVYPILKKRATRKKRADYGRILRTLYDYPHSAQWMERHALEWLGNELRLYDAVRAKLARHYGCRNDRTAVHKRLIDSWRLAPKDILPMVQALNTAILPVMRDFFIDVPKNHKTTIITTPDYLQVFLPSAAVQPFGTLTRKPFNIYFVTPNPNSNLVDLMQTLIHEEYGHCVHYTLASQSKKRELKMETALHGPITEGLSFQRELEFVLFAQHSEQVRQALSKIIPKKRMEEFILALELETRKWRLVRFLRAIYDVRVNTGKMSVVEFIEWAHKKTGVEREIIYNQTFRVGVPAGYLPGYSMFGMELWRLQRKLAKKTIKDFNTKVASSGFPGQSILLRELESFVE